MNLNLTFKKTYRAIFLSNLLIFSFLGTSFSTAWAESIKSKEKWYEVEVIVLANNDKSLQATEKWPEKPGIPPISQVLELFTPAEILIDDVDKLPMYYVEPLDPGENNLSKLANKIQNANDYTLLIHRSWRQRVSQKKESLPVYLDDNNAGDLYQPLREEEFEEEIGSISPEQLLLDALLAEENSLNESSADTPFFIHELDPIIPFEETEGLPIPKPVQLGPMGPPKHSIFGILQFFKNRYLHIAIDFSFKPEPYEPIDNLSIESEPGENPFLENVLVVNEHSQDNTFSITTNEEQPTVEQGTPTPGNISDNEDDDLLSLGVQEKPIFNGFRLTGSKRIRINEIHYFDHPTFGVIVRVINYVEPEVQEKETEETVESSDQAG